jgi:hypothetical protein
VKKQKKPTKKPTGYLAQTQPFAHLVHGDDAQGLLTMKLLDLIDLVSPNWNELTHLSLEGLRFSKQQKVRTEQNNISKNLFCRQFFADLKPHSARTKRLRIK